MCRRVRLLQISPAPPPNCLARWPGSGLKKSKVVDLHCHYLNPVVNAKTAHLDFGKYHPTTVFADDLTRETNVKQMKTRAPKLTGVTQRLQDMDRMGVDIQAICPAPYQFFYWTEADYGAELALEVNEGIAQIAADRPDRFVGMGSVPLQDSQLETRNSRVEPLR